MNYTILVNRENPIKDKYFKNLELVDYLDILNEPIRLEKNTLKSYLELKGFLEKKGINIGINSTLKMKYDEDYMKQLSSSIRTNEHNTGLAIDLSIKSKGRNLIENNDLIANETVFFEIHRYLKEFGFILRYPKNKEQITNHSYVPWHIRYVGKIAAELIYDNNLTLEEYLNDFSGILVINKEKNMTSRDVVNIVSDYFGIKKIGHTGTLDPIAEGLLVLTIGKATKIVELLTATYKEYIAEVKLGVITDTLDITGKVLDTKKIPSKEHIKEIVKSYQKTYLQEVPKYSAVKVAGKKLYEYARKNQEVVIPKKEVTIRKIKLLSTKEDTFTFKATVSKGCYIRSLIRDIGNSLNTYAIMTKLIRTKQGIFNIKDSYTLEQIKEGNFKIYNIEDVLDYKKVEVDETIERKIITGQKIENIYNIEDKVIFLNNHKKILGIYQKEGEVLKTWKNFV